MHINTDRSLNATNISQEFQHNFPRSVRNQSATDTVFPPRTWGIKIRCVHVHVQIECNIWHTMQKKWIINMQLITVVIMSATVVVNTDNTFPNAGCTQSKSINIRASLQYSSNQSQNSYHFCLTNHKISYTEDILLTRQHFLQTSFITLKSTQNQNNKLKSLQIVTKKYHIYSVILSVLDPRKCEYLKD